MQIMHVHPLSWYATFLSASTVVCFCFDHAFYNYVGTERPSRICDYVISCYFCFQTRGDSLWDTLKMIDVDVEVTEGVVQLEVASDSEGKGVPRSFTLPHINLETIYDSYLDLNNMRSRKFKKVIQEHVKRALYGVLYGPFRHVLFRAIMIADFPQVRHVNPYGRSARVVRRHSNSKTLKRCYKMLDDDSVTGDVC